MKKLIVLIFVVLVVSGCVGQISDRQIHKEQFIPQDRIDASKFHGGIIHYNLVIGISAEGSKSMIPFSGGGSKVLLMEYDIAKDLAPLQIGDIIVYKNQNDKNRVHRIVDIGFDKVGIYYITKGDNNWWKDSERIREKRIEYVVVGVLY